MGKKNSKRWSMKDIRTITKFIKEAVDNGGSEEQGKIAAAQHFGITINAIRIRYGRYLRGLQVPKKNTTKVPIKRKTGKRGNYKKKQFSPAMLDAIQGNAVTEVNTYIEKQSMTKELRKMVIDLMNTSGHIKAVSIDLSSKSFTVIY